MKIHKKIQAFERDKIAFLLASKASLREISRILDRSFSSIRDEVKRNSHGGVYTAIKAQELSQKRNKESRKFNPFKSPEIYSHVHEKLRDGWSSEEVSGRAKRENGGKTVICHETIYKHIYDDPVIRKEFVQYLVRKHQKRRK